MVSVLIPLIAKDVNHSSASNDEMKQDIQMCKPYACFQHSRPMVQPRASRYPLQFARLRNVCCLLWKDIYMQPIRLQLLCLHSQVQRLTQMSPYMSSYWNLKVRIEASLLLITSKLTVN
jgi:hypothetical protein